MYGDRLAGIEGLDLLCADRAPERRSWFVYVVQLPDEADRDRVMADLASHGIASKAYLPCIHLQPLYRERFGYAGGEFPVAERAGLRCLGLPFYTRMPEEEVELVCTALRAALGR
jgi:perosamine synthetase